MNVISKSSENIHNSASGNQIEPSAVSEEVKSRVLSIGEVSPVEDLLASFLRQHDIILSFSTPEAAPDPKPGRSPNLVLLNLDELKSSCLSKIDHARSYGVPVICTIPLEEAKNPNLIAQLPVDDYIFRPYRLEKLLHRMQVLLEGSKKVNASPTIEKRRLSRRKADRQMSEQHCAAGGNVLSIDDREKSVRIGKRQVFLTPKEYSLFRLFASEVGRVFSPEEIIEHAWPAGERTSKLDVQQYVHLLRKKIEVDPKQPEMIVSVKGFGYKLIIPYAE